jgi:hypothetical protein
VGEFKALLGAAVMAMGMEAGGPSAGKPLPPNRMRVIFGGKLVLFGG